MIIGICGEIASGKTTACKYLEEKHGFIYISPDAIGREVLNKEPYISIVYEKFGTNDRQELKDLCFNNKEVLKELECVITPAVRKEIKTLIEKHKDDNVIVEGFKKEFFDYFGITEILKIVDSDKRRKERLMTRSNIDKDTAESIMRISRECHKGLNGYIVIHNLSTEKALKLKVDSVIKLYN